MVLLPGVSFFNLTLLTGVSFFEVSTGELPKQSMGGHLRLNQVRSGVDLDSPLSSGKTDPSDLLLLLDKRAFFGYRPEGTVTVCVSKSADQSFYSLDTFQGLFFLRSWTQLSTLHDVVRLENNSRFVCKANCWRAICILPSCPSQVFIWPLRYSFENA